MRNYVVFGQFVFIKSNLGNELFKGNNEYATGYFKLSVGRAVYGSRECLRLRGSDEITQNRFLLKKAVTFIKEHPQRFATLTISRFIYYWTFTEKSIRKIWVPLVVYFGVLILAVTGKY